MRTASMMRRWGALVTLLISSPCIGQELKTFKNWVAGCDNLRTCTALGLPIEDGGSAYLKITREGGGEAEPQVDFIIAADGGAAGNLAVTFYPPDATGFMAEPLSARGEGDFLHGHLEGAAARRFIVAALQKKSLDVAVARSDPSRPKQPGSGSVSLSGMAAAMLFVDDQQQRVGTSTALKAVGDRDAATIPKLPALPSLAATRMQELADPLPPLPASLAQRHAPDDCRGGMTGAMTIRLSPTVLLWGLCASSGAYNVSYDFFLVRNGHTHPVVFERPLPAHRSDGTLTNPSVADDGLTLTAFEKGRGIADCGVDAAWTWDGATFRLARYSAMEECRGVAPDDWPVVYRARVLGPVE